MDMLSHEYPVKDICKMMGVSRSGYYKWLRREPSSREINREFMVGVVEDIHSEHPTRLQVGGGVHKNQFTVEYQRQFLL